jgi:hypothetical protein
LTIHPKNDSYAGEAAISGAAFIHRGDLSMKEQQSNKTTLRFIAIGSRTATAKDGR